MKSGLEGRNNVRSCRVCAQEATVSMKSGLEGRNNTDKSYLLRWQGTVSMKSGLEGRNNFSPNIIPIVPSMCLNEVRPRRPEQSASMGTFNLTPKCLSQ